MAIARLFQGLLEIPEEFITASTRGTRALFEEEPAKLRRPELIGGGRGLASFEDTLEPEQASIMRNNLVLANKMFKKGEANEDILARTGFYFDENGKPKYEIDDSEADFIIPFSELKPGQPVLMGDLLKHDKFYSFYPELRDTPVNFYRGKSTEVGGFNVKTGEIDMNLNSTSLIDEDPVGSVADLLHETQHAIQKFEKFSQGGSRQQFLRDIATPTDKQIEEAFIKYLKLAGEAEARNVSFRYSEPKYDKAAKILGIKSKDRTKGKNVLQTLTKDRMSEKYGITPAQLTDQQGNVIDIRNETGVEDLSYKEPIERTI